MINTNYIVSIVKILENPTQTVINQIKYVQFRVQFPQPQTNQIIRLVCWGKLASSVRNNYQIYDHILIEGYLSINTNTKRQSNMLTKDLNKIEITVLKVYPLRLI